MLHAKRQDGLRAFNFMDIRQVSMSFIQFEDEQNIRYLLQNATLLEKLYFSINSSLSLVGLHDILSPIARTLKVLGLRVPIYGSAHLPLGGLCEGLEAMAGHYMLEALSIEFLVGFPDTEDFRVIGYSIQKVERVLVKPEWSALRQVSFKVTGVLMGNRLFEALQSLPNKYLTLLSKLESVSFNYSVLDPAFVEYCDDSLFF